MKAWPKPVNGLERFLIDTAVLHITVNVTRFCDVLVDDQKPILILWSRFKDMQVETTGWLGKLRKLAF